MRIEYIVLFSINSAISTFRDLKITVASIYLKNISISNAQKLVREFLLEKVAIKNKKHTYLPCLVQVFLLPDSVRNIANQIDKHPSI